MQKAVHFKRIVNGIAQKSFENAGNLKMSTKFWKSLVKIFTPNVLPI